MRPLYLISVWIHIVCAITWIGGMIFLSLVLVPILKKGSFREQLPALMQSAGVRFRLIGWLALALLLATGIFQLAYRGYHFSEILKLKLILVVLVIVFSALHDFWIGPRVRQQGVRYRQFASWIGRLNLILALAIVALAVSLAR